MRPRHAGFLRIVTAGVIAGSLLNAPGMARGEWNPVAAGYGALRTPIGLSRPFFLAVDAHGTVYVSDYNNQRVVKLSPAGQLLAAWTMGKLGVDVPYGEAVDRQGHLYVASQAHIWTYSSTGKRLATWQIPVVHARGAELRATLMGLALDTQGNVYASDAAMGRIWKLSPQGKLLAHWAVNKPWPVVENQGLYMDATGGGIAVDTQGHLYVVDRLHNRIVTLSPQGRVLAVWGQGGNERAPFVLPSSVAVDARGTVYVGDSGHLRIVKLSSQGRVLAQWGRSGTGPGRFSGNLFVAVDTQGMVYVADDANNTVQKFSSTGTLLAVWQ